MRYTELQVTTNFSFLQGASHPEEMIEQAFQLGYESIAITDHNTFAGLVRGHVEANKRGIKFIPACQVDLIDGPSLLAYPSDKDAYARLSALLSMGNLRAEKGECHLYAQDVFEHAEGSFFIIIPPEQLNEEFNFDEFFLNDVKRFRQRLGTSLFIAAWKGYHGDDAKRLHRIASLSREFQMGMVATNNVYYHDVSRRQLQDVMTCVREKCTIHQAGFKLHANAERYLKPVDEMYRLFRQYPDAIKNALWISEQCNFSLSQLKYQYPKEITSGGRTPQEELVYHTWIGAAKMFGEVIPDKVRQTILYELKFIEEMNYAEYFLTVFDIVQYARGKGILCQGRGSAANSTVCYCLGITSVDPSKFDLLFERFISSARNEPPDIDVDFEHERREEVIQYIYNKYGRERAAIVATVTQQHHKGAIRDVGKAMGLSIDTINRLSALIWDFNDDGFDENRIRAQGINPDDPLIRKVLELTQEFMGFPRQLGQHTGGFVITDGKLTDLCPILNARMPGRTNIEWNKDDIEALGFLKIDVLALGMLTCIRKAFHLAHQHYNKDFTLANIPQEDPGVFDMVSRADTIGVFQIESRAQQAMLPLMKPKCFYDLVIEVAIVRPGPIQGDMVHPYLRRRNGKEEVTFPSKELESILGRTLGVPLFQEQAMKIAIVAAGFSPAEADALRRSMATFKMKGLISHFEQKLVQGMVGNGYSEEYARRVFRQLEGFGSYGFPESHAVSFALLVYVSAWLKCYYPDVFACALLNSLPMGFYQPAQIVSDAQNHGVVVRPVDVNYSEWDNTLEEQDGRYKALRLGFRQINGIREEDMKLLVDKRNQGYRQMADLKKAGLSDASLQMLADADAFRSMHMDRRKAFWETSSMEKLNVFSDQMDQDEKGVELPEMTLPEHVVYDYSTTSLSLKAHPVSLIREQLDQFRILPSSELAHAKHGDIVKVAGLILVRQRPGTAKGVCFITLEDETGTSNLVVFPNLFDKYRKEIIQSVLLMVEGKLQREGEVIHVIVRKCTDFSGILKKRMSAKGEAIQVAMSRADETSDKTHSPSQSKIFGEGRNFK